MHKDKRWHLMLFNAILLPVIPMLYLYNQNAKYLSFSQVAVIAFILAVLTAGFFMLFRALFHSEFTALFACVVLVILIFSYNVIYNKFLNIKTNAYITLLIIPALAYVLAYIFNKLLIKKKFDNLPKLICIIMCLVLLMNMFTFTRNSFSAKGLSGENEYKTSFITDNGLPAPNVYWILCDGMLGFEAMEKYFNEPQTKLTAELEGRGFTINKSAMLESGHFTKIAIPELMCPEYCEKYLTHILDNHETAMRFRDKQNTDLFNACYYNETINAFSSKGYTTVSISLDEDYFFPTTDFFYYITTPFISDSYYEGQPYYVKNSDLKDSSYLKQRFNVKHLGDVFLGGIPDIIFEKLNKNNIIKHQLSATADNIDEILPGSIYAKKNATMINSIYDSLYSDEIQNPKFVLVHDFMAHFPICFDKNGNLVDKQDSIKAYPGHHAYATSALVDIVDMVLKADPGAVIVLQADHGVHIWEKEKIVAAFGSGSEIGIWNNVFSAVRIPVKYQSGDEHYAVSDPLNISRYLVNSFVGDNYTYVIGK